VNERPPAAEGWSREDWTHAKAKWERLGTPEGLIENALRQLEKACQRASEDLHEARRLLEGEESSA
jgi:hypothetical protein